MRASAWSTGRRSSANRPGGEGVDDSKLGSFTRADGRVQATYNDWPLYYWINDTEPGQTTGQDVQGVWYVLDRDGEPIR